MESTSQAVAPQPQMSSAPQTSYAPSAVAQPATSQAPAYQASTGQVADFSMGQHPAYQAQAQAPQAKKSEPSAPKYSVPTYENHWFQAPKFHSPKAVALLTGAPAPKVIAKPGAFRRRRAASHPTSLHRIDEYESESDDEPQDRAAAPELLPAPPTAVAAAAALPAAQAGVAPARSESTREIRPLFAMTWNARHWR